MRNCYKREDVFLCRHDAHRRFDHRVSAHHVLRDKRCHPEGCVSFLWKCKLLGKGGACPRGYRHVGNNCTQCRHYAEEKIHRRPEVLLPPEAFAEFREECRLFDEWLDGHAHRLCEIGGEITDIRPHLVEESDGPRARLRLRGYLARLMPAWVGLHGFEDALYLRLPRGQQERHRLAPGDRLEAEGWIRLDRGRLVGEPLRRIRVEERSGQPPARWEQALLDRSSAVRLPGQPERCLRCARGLLIDVQTRARRPGARPGGRRELLCLEGIGRPEDCPYQAWKALAGEGGDRREGQAGCNLLCGSA
ncbi:MAG: hypothetical protein FJY75_10510 [Candidatus Eisenbacteria bacterium]|uniref:Uncharacterized protein n=1 Tax=Eiseniibacteriota bacterium TaxID=2212470 RepID=A0A937XE54_UNCEI|nr:hypothetical protein [Candidatus Eisenbacteria bacterium]